MEREFILKHAPNNPELQRVLSGFYADVVEDLVTEVRRGDSLGLDQDERYLQIIAVEGIRYAREFTRDIAPSIIEARRSKALQNLKDAIYRLELVQARRAADREAAREAALLAAQAERRAVRAERRKAREAVDGLDQTPKRAPTEQRARRGKR